MINACIVMKEKEMSNSSYIKNVRKKFERIYDTEQFVAGEWYLVIYGNSIIYLDRFVRIDYFDDRLKWFSVTKKVISGKDSLGIVESKGNNASCWLLNKNLEHYTKGPEYIEFYKFPKELVLMELL